MEAIEKRFRFYQKSIFFSDFNIEQHKKPSQHIEPVGQKNTKKIQFSDQLYNPLYSPNNSMIRPQHNSTKPPKTTPSIGNNTISFYSPKVLNRPVTVNPTPIHIQDPKSHFVEDSKQFKTESYLNRLPKSNELSKPKIQIKTSNNDLQTKPVQLFESVKIKQHEFQGQSSTSRSNTQHQQYQHFQQTNVNDSSTMPILTSPQVSPKTANGVPHLYRLPTSLLKKQAKISNDEISKYLTYRKKVNHSIIHNNTSKLITNLNRINHAKSLENVKSQNQQQQQNNLAQFKSNSMMTDLMTKQPACGDGGRSKDKHTHESNFTSQSCLANPMNNYNLYFSNNNKPSLSTKPDQNLRVHQTHQRLNSTKWSSPTNENQEVITPKKSINLVNNNNYFNHKNSIDDATSKLTFNNEMILARSLTYDFRFKTEFVDSKLNLATAMAAKSGETVEKKSSSNNVNNSTNISQVKKITTNHKFLTEAEEENVEREVRKILDSDSAQVLFIDHPKLTCEEEMLVVKSKQKCNDWFDRHFSYSNTSSPITDLNDF